MAKYNTYSDAANTAVRAFLTQVGGHYLGKQFNTGGANADKIYVELDESFV